MQKSFKTFACIVLLVLASSLKIYSQNLLNNGDFESGFGVGFFSNGAGYTRITAPFSGTTSPGNYAITTNPQPMNTANFLASGDHSSGFGNMMIIDGNTTPGQQNLWEAGNAGGGVCSLTIGTTYTFSFWIKSVSITVTNALTQAALGVQILNASSVTLVSGSLTAPLPAAGWQKVTYTFVAQSTCCNIKLYNNNTNAVGNDFALDDFSVTPPLVPLSINYSFTNPTCPNTSDGSISAYGVGGTVPYGTYSLTGTATQTNNNGVFPNLSAGTYSVSVTDAAGATATQTNIVLTAPTDLTVSAGSTICSGAAVTLNVSGSTSGYTWTANPLDASLTNPTASNPTVSPTQTTIYTVTSSTATPTSLISNGNFTSGNTGFTTDYQYLVTTVPAGAQKTYGIVVNSNSWFGGFSNCFDHTSGSGNMMVVDGSTSNAGNDRVWCQTVPVVAGQNYTFSYYIESLSSPNFSNIDVIINGAPIGSSIAPVTNCSWEQKTHIWNSGTSTTAVICIYDRTITANGNDFAIDDISFTGPVSCTLQKTVTITVVNTINLTITNPPAVCAPSTVDITLPSVTAGSTTGTVLTYWADAAATTSPLTTVAAAAIAVGNTYYIKCTLGSCSIIKPVVVTINTASSIPVPVVVTPLYYCQGSTATPLTATALSGATLNWYGTNATGGTASTIAPTPSTATVGTTTYYVSQTVGLCESPRKAINVIVNNATGTITMFCDPAQVTTSPVTSVYFDWNNLPGPPVYNYTYSINGGPLVSGSTNISHLEVFGVLPGQSVTLTIVSINGFPCVAPITNTCSNCAVSTTPTFTIPSSFCSGAFAPVLPSTSIEGISGTWVPAVVSNTASGSYVFTPNTTLFPCTNGPVTKGITVTPIPTAGTLSGNQNVCVGSTTNFTSTTGGGSWTSSNTTIATVIAATGVVTGVLGGTATLTYTITGTGGCSNATATRTVTVTATPSAGTLSGNQAICVGQTSTFSSSIIGGSWSSSNTAMATVNASTGIITGVAAGTATISYTVTGIGGCANAVVTRTVTITAIPNAGNVSGTQNICVGLTTIFTATVTGGTYSSSNTAVATVNATTGLITGVSSGTATITYTVLGTGGCSNGSATRTVTVSNAPVAGTLSGNQNICISTTTTFSSTVSGGSWSTSNAAIATVNATTGVITGVSAGTITITYTVAGAGGCANVNATRTITVNALTNSGTLSGNQAICISFSTTFVATTIGGVWSSSNAAIATVNAAGVIIGITAGTATITYTVAGSGGCASASVTRTVTVSAAPNPGVLSGTQNLCVGQSSTFVSTVTGGTWSSSNTTLATINSTTGVVAALGAGTAIITYTVAGTGGCANTSSTRTVTVNANVTPTFNPVATICSGSVLAALPLTSINGINGLWTPALNNTSTTQYTFTPTAGQCATNATLTITVNPKIIPLFSLFAPICQGATPPILPISSENVPPILGTWSPPVSTATVGTSVYTFTPNPGQCVSSLPTTLAITVAPVLVPNFAVIPPFCNGKTPIPTLSNTSPNGVVGTWSPAVINNTLSGTYIFTPNANQCATTKTLTVTIIPKTIPNFSNIPPFCKGSTAPLLSLTSPNGITGTWLPLTIDNTTSGTFPYTFTPNATECATTQILNVTVTDPVLPNFPDIKLCTGATSPVLTATSPNGITGTWLPSTVDNIVSSTYVFTPNTGECAISQTINVTINQYTLVAIDGVVTNYFEDNQIITVLASDPGNYSYQLDDGLFQESNVFENVSSGIHTIKVIDLNGCSAPLNDNVLVINYPKFFTPNEDTYNDKWNIFGLKDQVNAVIFIYDRYGKLLKEISPSGEGWDGTYNGRPVPSADYWFTVDYLENNITKQFKAHFSLKR